MTNSTDKNVYIPAPLKEGSFKHSINVQGIEISWDVDGGTCNFRGIPVAMMWVDSTLAGLMSGVQSMVGPERFNLALQAEGRKSVESDWLLISSYQDFAEGFAQLNLNARVAGWGDWQLVTYDPEQKECVFRAFNNWEGGYQKALGVCWGSGMLAGKLAGICSKLFGTNCWATQTRFVAKGDGYDEFVVAPSMRDLEHEIENLLRSDNATRADMAVALRKIQDAETRYRTVADFTYDWETWVAPDGRWIYCSPSCKQISGHAPEDFLRSPGLLESIIHPDDRPIFLEHVRRHEQTQGEIQQTSFRIIQPDGSLVWIEHICRPVYDDKGKYLGRRTSNRDITVKKRAEEELINAKEAAEAANRAKSVFLATMSHELRTPMNAIMGMTSIAKRYVSDPKQSACLEKVSLASKHLLGLIDDILDMSRIESERLSLDHANFTFGEVIENLVGKMSQEIADHGLALHIDVPAPLSVLAFKGDQQQLSKILLHLTSNAIKFTPTGGSIAVRAKIAEESPETALIRLEVQDTGIGVAAEDKARIFNSFEQADGSLTRKYGGTGLGLALCKRLAEKMGGAIGVESEPGQGSTFWIDVRLDKTR